MITGGCFCGAVRYQIEQGSYTAANCHCTMCRRIHAAPYVSWLVVPIQKFSYQKGEPAQLNSSVFGRRYFCTHCGTHLACINESYPEIIDITIGSLDAPESFNPTMDVFEDTRLNWVKHHANSKSD